MYRFKKKGGSNWVSVTPSFPNLCFFGPGLTPTFFATLQEAGVLAYWTER
jgi:hypothetical protein